ncbi:T-cell acute lymphocytic leukemia protein 1 [Halotydeus destructor]|nr:T-cell acute lymphocytic leukemia protein 1 [Halotydeus destructor]
MAKLNGSGLIKRQRRQSKLVRDTEATSVSMSLAMESACDTSCYSDFDSLSDTTAATPASSSSDETPLTASAMVKVEMEDNDEEEVNYEQRGVLDESACEDGDWKTDQGSYRGTFGAGVKSRSSRHAAHLRQDAEGNHHSLRRYCKNGMGRNSTNVRERNRQKCVNLAFAELRSRLPSYPIDKKFSKHEILRSTIKYIRILENILEFFKQEDKETNDMAAQSSSANNQEQQFPIRRQANVARYAMSSGRHDLEDTLCTFDCDSSMEVISSPSSFSSVSEQEIN